MVNFIIYVLRSGEIRFFVYYRLVRWKKRLRGFGFEGKEEVSKFLVIEIEVDVKII